jgi:hypothetical protein
MSERDWQAFFDLVDRIAWMDGPWQEKAATLRRMAEEHGAAGSLEELASWLEE